MKTSKIIFDLRQFGEKTEKATSKKREDSRKKGQVVFSKDTNGAATLLIAIVTMNAFGGFIVNRLSESFKKAMDFPVDVDDAFTMSTVSRILGDAIFDILLVSGPIILIIMVTGVLLSYLQVGILFTSETLQFKLDKLDPVAGLKRMFSVRSLVELAKNLVKIFILVLVSYNYIYDKLGLLFDMIDFPPYQIGLILWDVIYNLSLRLSIILLVIGVIDYGYKRWQNEKDMMMSKQEIKEEYKMMEGNPLIKSKIKEKQRQMAMSRMMQDVPKADVVITNPTHFAVAIKYDRSKHDAPYVVAKGQDLIAARIKKLAKESQVPVVENKPLARELFATVKLGQTVPESLFHAVAEVLAFIYKSKKNK